MDSAVATDCELMLDSSSLSYEIDAKRARFPYSLVWTPLPVLSWFIPFIGHIGICREDGVILDFAGPNFVCVDNFAFGAAARYIQIRKEQCLLFNEPDKEVTWDDAIRKSTQEFQHKAYSIFTCNCHSFVANNLNRLCYGGHNRWNVVNLAALIFLKGRWVNKSAIIRSYLPFVIIFSLGILLGGWTFLTGLAAFTFVLLSWFILGSYCLKNLIEL